MNDFLETMVLDNPLKSYLIAALVIGLTWLIKKYVAHYAAGLLYLAAQAIWNKLDKKAFVTLIAKPLGDFLLVLVVVLSLHKLTFPSFYNTLLYRITFKELLNALGSLLLIFSLMRFLIKSIDFIALILDSRANLTIDPSDNQLIIFFKDFIKAVMVVIGFILMLKYAFGLHVGNLLTGLSLVTAAVALAMRESLENLIASFIIFFDKPFTLGDYLHVKEFTGTVEKIGLRSTRVRTDEKSYLTIPNKQIVDNVLDNLSMRTQRKGEIKLEVKADSEKIATLISKIEAILQQEEIEDSTVYVADIVHTSLLIKIEFFTGTIPISTFNQLKQAIILEIKKLVVAESVQNNFSSTAFEVNF